MKDSQFIRAESARFVQDVMDPTVQIEPGITKGTALQRLKQQNVPYGVISGTEGEPFRIITTHQLSTTSLDEQVQVFSVNIPALEVTIQPQDNLDNIVQTWAKHFAVNQDLTGMVVQEQNEILGVLPREKIEEHAQIMGLGNFASMQQGGYVGYPVDRLVGVSVFDSVKYYCLDCPRGQECPNGPEERDVTYYDPDHPSVCKWHQHLMFAKQ